MAQLVEQSLPTPEVRGSNPVIGRLFISCVYLYEILYHLINGLTVNLYLGTVNG